jgi:hypothetical protein
MPSLKGFWPTLTGTVVAAAIGVVGSVAGYIEERRQEAQRRADSERAKVQQREKEMLTRSLPPPQDFRKAQLRKSVGRAR